MKLFIASQGRAEREMQRVGGTSPELQDETLPLHQHLLLNQQNIFTWIAKHLVEIHRFSLPVLRPCGFKGQKQRGC